MKKPNIEKFMSTDEWRQRGGVGGLRKEVRLIKVSTAPDGCFCLELDLPSSAQADRFGDALNGLRYSPALSLGFAFDPQINRLPIEAALGLADRRGFLFRPHATELFWAQLIDASLRGLITRAALALLPGVVDKHSHGCCFDRPEVLSIEVLPPLGADLSKPDLGFIREWVQRIANGPPEKSERYELVVEALRDLPAPAPEADPDQVMLEAMQALTAALKETTHELRCLQGKTE
jgi:hypothetical protein